MGKVLFVLWSVAIATLGAGMLAFLLAVGVNWLAGVHLLEPLIVAIYIWLATGVTGLILFPKLLRQVSERKGV